MPVDTEAKEENEERPHSVTQHSCELPSIGTAAPVCHMPAWWSRGELKNQLQSKASISAFHRPYFYTGFLPKLSTQALAAFCNLPSLTLPLPSVFDSALHVLLSSASIFLFLFFFLNSSSPFFFSPLPHLFNLLSTLQFRKLFQIHQT